MFVNLFIILLVLVLSFQVNPFVIAMLAQVNSLILVPFVQVNPFMIVLFAWVNLLLLVLPVQVNSLVVVMFVILNPLVLVLFLLVNPSKSFSAINVHASKPAYGSNVCWRKPVSVGNVCPSKTISVSNARSGNSDSVINVHSTKSVSTSNISLGKLVCRNNVCLSNSVNAINVHPTKSVKARNMCSGKPVCRNNVCQGKPTNVNILPCKPVLTDYTYHVGLSILSQQLFFIFFLSILIFSVYYKFSIITMNIFTNLLLAIVILLSKLTCLREYFIFISRNSTVLRFSLNTYITFQLCRTMLLLKTSEVSFFTSRICVFAILTITVLNFSSSNVQTNCFKSILQNFGKILNSFALILLVLVIW